MVLWRFRDARRRIAAGVAVAVTAAVAAATFGWPRAPRVDDDVAHARGALDPARVASPEVPPVGQWTRMFRERQERGDWDGLEKDLRAVAAAAPDLYAFYSLGYLHARAALAGGRAGEALSRFQPFLAANHPLRDLALHHASVAAAADGEEDDAARLRGELIDQYPEANHRQAAVEAQIAWLAAQRDVAGLRALTAKVSGEQPLAREVEARLVELLIETDLPAATARGLRLLRANAGDDPAERVTRVLDRPEVLDRLPADDWVLLGESARSHRHYDRAVALLERALPRLEAKRADLLFAMGRAHFHAERYAEAEARYVEAAQAPSANEARANAWYNASRAAQLRGDDTVALAHLARAIPLGRGTSRASSALTQRVRIHVDAKRFAQAAADLRAVVSGYPRSHAVVEASLAYAVGLVAAGRGPEAVRALRAIRPRLLEKNDVPEVKYWHARAVERSAPREAVRLYLEVMASEAPTHHFYFARRRIDDDQALSSAAAAESRRLAAEAERLLAAGQVEEARNRQTSAYLVAPAVDRAGRLAGLKAIYERLPTHRAILEAGRPAFPELPLFGAAGRELQPPPRLDLLLALGLFDDAAAELLKAYPLHPMPNAILRAEALRRAGSGRASVYAAEVALEDVPAGYRRELLPPVVRELLFPRHYWDQIQARAKEHGADPRLVLSIMREESRFNVRAKSPAAARGLLQFIIGTARRVGEALGLVEVQPEDLYDPEIIIRLGAKYIGDLQARFGGDPYKAAAAYNAGPFQAALWSRLSPAEGHDQYLTAINFDETKNYVRKVMNSYERYRELYGNGPAGP